MSKYLEPTDSDAFVDFPLMGSELRGEDLTKLCPICVGHGGWNLKLNAYPLHGKENTPENRHRYSHFICQCSHCNGWGYVREDETCSGHEWQHIRKTGNCLNLYRCNKCGKEWEVDSSD